MRIHQNLILLLSGAILTACVAANASPKAQSDYRIIAYKNCEKVVEKVMTTEQYKAYQALEMTEVAMKELEKPLKLMEQELAQYSAKLDALDGDMVIEDDNQLIVNKALVKKHQAIAELMEQVVEMYEDDIEKIELQGDEIEVLAERFEEAIDKSFTNIDYDQVRIVSRDDQDTGRCYAGISSH